MLNDSDASRIHLVVDTVGGSGFWDMVARGRAHGIPMRADWKPRQVLPQQGVQVEFPLESINMPAVMTPWEMNAHFGLIFSDAVSHPQLPQLQLLAAQLVRGWRGLWAQYGSDPAGYPAYQKLIDQFAVQAGPLANPLHLGNGGSLAASLSNLIVQSALRKEPASGNGGNGRASPG